MPTLYAESDFTAGRYDDKTITVGAGNYGLSVTNFSDQGFQALVQRTGETYVLPPYSLYTFPVQPNDSVTIQHLSANYNASKIGDRYLRYDQVSNTVEPKLIPLSSFPVYNQEITGNVNATVVGGTVNATVEGGVTVTGGTINATVAGSVDANITGGSITANISNASINTQLLNAQIRTSNGMFIAQQNGDHDEYTVSNLTAGQSYYLSGDIAVPGGLVACNKIAIFYRSANNYTYTVYLHGLLVSYNPSRNPIATVLVSSQEYFASQLEYPKWVNFPSTVFNYYDFRVVPNSNVTSDRISIYAIAVLDAAQNGVQTAGAGIYSLANNAYTTIFTASNPVIIRGLYIGTGSPTVGQFRIDKNGSTPFLSLNTTTVSQYYPINPGYFLGAGETLQAYQATGSGLTANITIFYT